MRRWRPPVTARAGSAEAPLRRYTTEGGERATEYLRASDPRPTVTNIAFPSATGRGQCVQSATETHVERQKMPPESVEIWMFKTVTVSLCAGGRCRRYA